MTTSANSSIVDSVWKDRIERALKYVCRMIDLKQKDDAVPFLRNIAEQYNDLRRPRMISESVLKDDKSSLYTCCSFNEITGDKLICSLSVLPQIDQLPNMFIYVPLQSNILCDTVTNLSDLLLDEESEDVKNLLISIQSDSLTEQQQTIRSASSSKRPRRLSKTSIINDRNNEFVFDEEHLLELLKRLKQQSLQNSLPMTLDDETNLFDTLIKLYPSSADLIRDRFGTIFESKRLQPKEFTPNIDNSLIALDTTVENILHSYFMLFCRRCHRYDCFLHKDKSIIPDLNNQSKNNSDIIYRPCNFHCYRRKTLSLKQQKRNKIELKRSYSEFINNNNTTFQISTNSFYSKRVKSNINKSEYRSSIINSNIYKNGFLFKPSLKRKLNNEILNWSSSDKSLFRVFCTIYGDNICMIADLLDKPCSQVYIFYLNEIQVNEKQLFLQRQLSTTSPNLIDVKINDEHKKKNLKHTTINTNNSEESIDDKMNIYNQQSTNSIQPTTNQCSSSRRSHSSPFRRQRSHQHILLNHHNNLLLEQKRHTYYPCDHDRSIPCNEHCYCIHSGNFCEKYCCCSSIKCDNRFPGCRCRSSCTTKQCPCYAAARECDPDLCIQCGADDFRNGNNNNNNNELITKSSCSCHNVAIQRSLHKSLLLAESDVAGWGIFTQVNIQRNEFIAEYCGEILTQDEGELRGRMYDTIGTSFLFDLNEEYMVDATRRGNKIRFANHSINPNCYAKVIMVKGDHRIGIYSKRFISAGEELFFDYRYGANHHLRFVGVEKYTPEDQADTLLM
ncbi:unnamed protein product [Rotaria sordida]|uniref:[histone H3]-lysine(27) N-trimethyltransferase n=1 Tax=Rotaria sordida TaxID=392033 RepID=A0A813S2T1_9BILA|nr:unnamed protein product [Rotaria sordida]CAF3583468.1 unnamed protein product [Rotaria sordida]